MIQRVNPPVFALGAGEFKRLHEEQESLKYVEDLLDNSDLREAMLEELSHLTSKMDVPDYRRQDFRWLAKHLPERNSNVPGFGSAMGLVAELIRIG